MKDKEVSKYLSLVLRHKPEELGIELDSEGWTNSEVLLQKMQAKGMNVYLLQLKRVVDTNDKKRFSFNSGYSKIRANQGHSVEVDLGLMPLTPPEFLFHGTAETNINTILAEGLKKQSRQHVHLSADVVTATKVGGRHGNPVVLLVKSGSMHQNGGRFYLSENKVWLTDFVAPEYLEIWKK